MFIIEDYKQFILTKVIGKAYLRNVDITNILLESLYQFDKAPGVYTENILSRSTLSQKFKKIILIDSNKPKAVSLNTRFLFVYGYKYCNKCKEVVEISNYGKLARSWDRLSNYCTVCTNISDKEYYKTETRNTAIKKYAIANREKINKWACDFRYRHPDIENANKAKRRACKLFATPSWLTKEQIKEILSFYTEAKRLEQETGIKYHVDHIVPLQGSNVCGLHVPWNLQVILAEENLRKSNKWQS